MYEPSHLRTFLSVAQTLSFTQAARRLGLRQSTVSQHVRRLEDATGRTLFTRDTHSVELTEDGEAMLGFARRILEVHEQATAFFTGTRLRGRLRFGASEDFVLTRLPEILEGFRHDHPEVDLELTVELSANWSGTTGWCGSARNGSAWIPTARCRSSCTRRPASPGPSPWKPWNARAAHGASPAPAAASTA
jgi:DNA-binding MarR family transcriptional regulator